MKRQSPKTYFLFFRYGGAIDELCNQLEIFEIDIYYLLTFLKTHQI